MIFYSYNFFFFLGVGPTPLLFFFFNTFKKAKLISKICLSTFVYMQFILKMKFLFNTKVVQADSQIWFSNFLIIFFIVQSFKNEILSKILDIQKYNIVRHWFSSKNWIFAIFFKKVSFDGFTHFSSKIHPKFNFIENPWYTKIQHCTTLIFLEKLDFCDFF